MTGSGKTHTIFGEDENQGVLFRSIKYFLNQGQEIRYEVKELYKNNIQFREMPEHNNNNMNMNDSRSVINGKSKDLTTEGDMKSNKVK